jgi:S1-C subfamily serine protease
MNKIIISILFLIFIIYLVNTPKKKIEKFSESSNLFNSGVVLVKVKAQNINFERPWAKEDIIQGSGSGFFISPTNILTNFHVIDNYVEILINIPFLGNKLYSCDVIMYNHLLDVAELKIKDYESEFWFDLDKAQIGNLQDVTLGIGYPLGEESVKITEGNINGHFKGDIQTDTTINPGNSGGPLVLKDNNNLVGINYAGLGGGLQNINFAIPIDYVNNFRKIISKGITKPLTLGIKYVNTSPILMEDIIKMDKPYNSGISISEIFSESNFNKIGLKERDIICQITINGIDYDISNTGDFTYNLKKINITDIYKIISEEKISINYLSKNNSTYTKKSKSDIKLDSIDISPLKFINYPFDDVKYIIIGGLIIMNLSINHILSYPYLLILPQYKKDEKYLIITSKIPTNNTIDKYNTISFPSIISEINGESVKSIIDLNKYLNNNDISKNDFLKVLLIDNTILVEKQDVVNENNTYIENELNVKLKKV